MSRVRAGGRAAHPDADGRAGSHPDVPVASRVPAAGWATFVVCTVLAGCAPDDAAAPAAELPVVGLGEPVLEIGVLEGDDELVFGALESVVRLPDGTIAVSDGGATRISLFDAEGDFLRSWGSEGDGPGEFRSLSRIYPLGPDSLMAAERYSGRLAVFDLDGELGRLQAGSELTGDSLFTLDSWLSGRFWIEGALTAEERGAALEMLDGLGVPPEWPGYRYAFATDDDAVWLRQPQTDGLTRSWTRVDDGGATAVVQAPTAFRPTHVLDDEVLGVWSDESGVHFVRVYRPAPTGQTAPAPSWLTAPASSAGRPAGPDTLPGTDVESDSQTQLTEQELMAEIRSAVRQMASAQEIHYSGHMTYTTVLDSLEAFERPETIVVDFLRADARGWAGVFSHSSADRICGLAYGFGTPPGWMPGRVICAPEPGGVEASVTGAAGAGS